MPTMPKTPFILTLLCLILLHTKCIARNTMDSSSPPNSAPTSPPSQPPSSSATSFTLSISEFLKTIIPPKYTLNLSPSPQPNPNPNPNTNANQSLKSICDSTDYPEICISSVSPILSSSSGGGSDVDPVSVLQASIKACIEPLNDTVGNLSSAFETTKSEASAIADCKDNYADALDNLHNALKAIQSRDIGTVNTLLSAVISDVSTCDDAFQDSPSPSSSPSPIAEFDELIKRMASNCLAVASLIH